MEKPFNLYTNMEHSVWMPAGLHSPTADRPRSWTTEDPTQQELLILPAGI